MDQKYDEKEIEPYDNNQEEKPQTSQMASQLTSSRRMGASNNEKKHQSDDDDDEVDPRERLFITFKWDTKINQMEQCDTKHMFYLLWLAFVMVEDRQKERNQGFKNYGREDRILKCPDLVQSMTYFIDWHLKDLDNNIFDGKYVKDTPRMECCEKIKEIAQVKEGWCIKIYKYLTKDVRLPSASKVSFPNYTHKAIGISLESLSVDDMKTLLTKEDIGIFAQIREIHEKLVPYEDDLIQFIVDEEVDGAKMLNMKRRDFIVAAKNYLMGDGDEQRQKAIKRLAASIGKIYALAEKADLNRIMR